MFSCLHIQILILGPARTASSLAKPILGSQVRVKSFQDSIYSVYLTQIGRHFPGANNGLAYCKESQMQQIAAVPVIWQLRDQTIHRRCRRRVSFLLSLLDPLHCSLWFTRRSKCFDSLCCSYSKWCRTKGYWGDQNQEWKGSQFWGKIILVLPSSLWCSARLTVYTKQSLDYWIRVCELPMLSYACELTWALKNASSYPFRHRKDLFIYLFIYFEFLCFCKDRLR